MPSFTFKGFTTGAPVALSATQDGTTVPASVATWGEATVADDYEGSFTITATTAETIPAPTAVWFEASNPQGFDVSEVGGTEYDPSFDGITYIWTVQRTGPGADEDTHGNYGGVPNLISNWTEDLREARVAYGKKVAFIFDEPDTTYDIQCWAIDQTGNRGIGTRITGEEGLVITTDNADDLYDGVATICLDPSGAFTGAPAGAQQVTTVLAMQGATNSGQPRRILIARGQDIPDFELDQDGESAVRYIGTFGSGPRPILRVRDNRTMFDFYQTGAPQLTIEGLDCRGLWDSATETGKPSSLLRSVQSSVMNLTVWNCRFEGFTSYNPTLNGSTPYVMVTGKTEITGWHDYGIFMGSNPNARIGLIGCDIAQNVDAINDSQNARDGMSNQQGPLRITGYATLYVAASSFLSRGGWSSGNDQPCLRMNSSSYEGAETIVERSTCEGGSIIATMSGSNSSTVERRGNHLFDKVLMLAGGGKTGREMIFSHFGGSTFRNVLYTMLDVPSAAGISFSNCMNLNPNQTNPQNLAAPFKIYNCTSLNLRSSATDLGDTPALTSSASFSDYTNENNIVHGPDLDTPVSVNSVTTSGASVFQPRYKGTRPNFDFEQGSLGGSVSNGGSFTLSYPSGTNQAYWQGIEAVDTLHMMLMDDTNYYAAFDGSFTVTYESSQIRITNTSGSTWSGGSGWKLRLDRKSQIPPANQTFGNPSTLALPVPVAGSAIATGNDGGGTGFWAYDDLTATPRPFRRADAPGQPQYDHTGTVRPAEWRADGAVQP